MALLEHSPAVQPSVLEDGPFTKDGTWRPPGRRELYVHSHLTEPDLVQSDEVASQEEASEERDLSIAEEMLSLNAQIHSALASKTPATDLLEARAELVNSLAHDAVDRWIVDQQHTRSGPALK